MGGGGKSGGGGGYSSGPAIQYSKDALKLQEKIYNEQRADAQPWYQTGTSAVNQLGMLMGLNPSAASSPSSRQALVDQYKPQFTTKSTNSTGSGQWIGNKGAAYQSEQDALASFNKDNGFSYTTTSAESGRPTEYYAPYQAGPGETSTTDTAALNAYVDNLINTQSTQNSTNPLYGSLAQKFGADDFQTDPGYQFRLDEGNKALERKLNAAGKTYSPEAAKALLSYGQQLGSEEYGNAYNRFNNDQGNLFNRLATLSGFGQTASGQIANAGSNYANAGSELYTGMGNAVTASNIARANQGSSMFNSMLGAGAQLGAAAIKSDIRHKENIVPMGEINGFPVYSFSYIENPGRTFLGVMAQQILELMPEAVVEMDGYLAVDYSKLGFPMREIITCH